jgi:hypothetical protein
MKDSNMQPVEWLMAWYRSNCDGDWEHQHGIHIGTLDNPGWYLDVNLEDTPKAGSILPRKLVERTEADWVTVEANDNMFKAHGGPENLLEMINLFAAFVEGRLPPDFLAGS